MLEESKWFLLFALFVFICLVTLLRLKSFLINVQVNFTETNSKL